MNRVKQDLLNEGMCPPYPRKSHSSDVTAVFTAVVVKTDRTETRLLPDTDFRLAIKDFSDLRLVKKEYSLE